MKIVTYADSRFKDMLALTKPHNERLNEVVVFEPNTFPIPPQYTWYKEGRWPEGIRGRLPFKPHVIKAALHQGMDCFAWLDADAICVRDMSPVFDYSFDIAVTLRRLDERNRCHHQIQYGYINTGVMFFRNTEATHRFVDCWIDRVETMDSRSDQEALNSLLLESDEMNSHGRSFIQERSGANIRLLSSDEYNWWYWPEPLPKTTKVIHMKTDKRGDGKLWCEYNLPLPCPVNYGVSHGHHGEDFMLPEVS